MEKYLIIESFRKEELLEQLVKLEQERKIKDKQFTTPRQGVFYVFIEFELEEKIKKQTKKKVVKKDNL